jgi:hypothetical protein
MKYDAQDLGTRVAAQYFRVAAVAVELAQETAVAVGLMNEAGEAGEGSCGRQKQRGAAVQAVEVAERLEDAAKVALHPS